MGHISHLFLAHRAVKDDNGSGPMAFHLLGTCFTIGHLAESGPGAQRTTDHSKGQRGEQHRPDGPQGWQGRLGRLCGDSLQETCYTGPPTHPQAEVFCGGSLTAGSSVRIHSAIAPHKSLSRSAPSRAVSERAVSTQQAEGTVYVQHSS